MHELRSANVAWGAAMLAQNVDEVVRCDRCQREALAPHGRGDALLDRERWPTMRCVFAASCRGHMRREWLN